MSNGKAFTVYVCYVKIQRSTYIDVQYILTSWLMITFKWSSWAVSFGLNPLDRFQVEEWVSCTRSGVSKTFSAVQTCRVHDR